MKPPKSLKNNRLLSDKASLSKFKSSSDFGLKLRNWPSRIRVDEALKKSVKRKKHKKTASNHFAPSMIKKPEGATHERSVTSYNVFSVNREKLRKMKFSFKGKESTSKAVKEGSAKKNLKSDKKPSFYAKSGVLRKIKARMSDLEKEKLKSKKMKLSNKKQNSKVGIKYHQKPTTAFKSNKTQYKPSLREFRAKPNMIINNNINIGQLNSKENKFKGNIKISIDFYDSKQSNHLRGEQNLYDKKALKKSKESGFYSKKNSVSRLEKRRPKEFYSISKAKSGGLSP